MAHVRCWRSPRTPVEPSSLMFVNANDLVRLIMGRVDHDSFEMNPRLDFFETTKIIESSHFTVKAILLPVVKFNSLC